MNYLFVRREGKPVNVTSNIAVARVMSVFGGLASVRVEPLYRLELTSATGKPHYVNCHGSVAAVRQSFAAMAGGFELRFVEVLAVLNPLANLRRENVQPSLVRVGRIDEIRPNKGRRKARSIIVRAGLPAVMATETVTELEQKLQLQGYGGRIDNATGIYSLDKQWRDEVPPVTAVKKRVRVPDPFSAQERFDF